MSPQASSDQSVPAAESHECQCGHGGSAAPEEAGPPADLSFAGAVVDKAIEFMTSKKIDETAIASALLGGALGMLARNLADEAVIGVLQNAIASVQAGELHQSELHQEGGSHP